MPKEIAGLATVVGFAVLGWSAAIRAEMSAGTDAAAPPRAVAQTVTQELTATIQAINHDTREVTLKDKDGVLQTVTAGPQIKRFNELKVGDTVTLQYYESVVYKIRKPGEAAMPATDSAVMPSKGPRPGGTAVQQQTATVTIKAIDTAVPSVTVQKEDGDTASFKVEDKAALGRVKVGDKVEITLTQALMISVR
jgi:Cu/Ag efflux protein CusF